MRRFFLDTEFNQTGTFVELLSIGLVSDDGHEYYAQNQDHDWSMTQEYVKENIFPLLDDTSWKPIKQIQDEVTTFLEVGVEQDPGIEIWAWYGNYDWVAFCGTIYGNMVAVPPTLPWNIMDLKQYADYLDHKERPAPPEKEHHALEDAKWNRAYHKLLIQVDREQRQQSINEYITNSEIGTLLAEHDAEDIRQYCWCRNDSICWGS